MVAWDELDAMGILHHARFLVHVERTFSALLEEMGYPYRQDIEDDGDRRHAVVAVTANYMAPVTSPGPLVVVLQFEHCGKSSLRMVWQALRPDGLMAAEGSRTVVHVDGTNRAEPWSEAFRERLRQALTAWSRP